MVEEHDNIAVVCEQWLMEIITTEKWKEETGKVQEIAHRNGEIRTACTDIDKRIPAVLRFSGDARTKKKQGFIAKLRSILRADPRPWKCQSAPQMNDNRS